MTSERQGEHPARPFGSTGGGFAEGEANPEEYEQDQKVGSFATGEEDSEEFPQDENLGSFAKGQEATDDAENETEGTFANENE
jgi:hypothetical protein